MNDIDLTDAQRAARVHYPATPVKCDPVTITVLGGSVHIVAGDFVFRIQNHPYAAKLGALENQRLKDMICGEAHRIANWLERMKREVEP